MGDGDGTVSLPRWRRPPLICLTGIDGCGKSTQAKRLAARLRDDGHDVAMAWTGGQPYISEPLVRMAKHRFRAPVQRSDGRYASRSGDDARLEQDFAQYLDRSNAMFRKSWVLRRGWTDVSLFEHAVEANLAVTRHLLKGRTVVCDRYLLKSVVNLAVLMDLPLIDLPHLLRHPALRLVPQPTVYLLLDVPPEVGYERKHDLPSVEYVARRVPIYRALAAYTNMPVFDATQPPEVIEEQIWTSVSATLSGAIPRRSGLRVVSLSR